MNKIIGFAWISTYFGCIGVAIKTGDNGEFLSYICPVPGINEASDLNLIVEFGTKCYIKGVKEIIAAHGTICDKEKFESI